jgi:methyl-accepting chemotaxis protein
MSYTAIGRKKVYASIEDLPENQKLVNGDRLLLQTEDGTALIDYENVKIDLQHTTFGDQFRNLVELSSTVESFASLLNTDIEDIKNAIEELKANVDNTNKILGTQDNNTESISTQISSINDSIESLREDVDGIT